MLRLGYIIMILLGHASMWCCSIASLYANMILLHCSQILKKNFSVSGPSFYFNSVTGLSNCCWAADQRSASSTSAVQHGGHGLDGGPLDQAGMLQQTPSWGPSTDPAKNAVSLRQECYHERLHLACLISTSSPVFFSHNKYIVPINTHYFLIINPSYKSGEDLPNRVLWHVLILILHGRIALMVKAISNHVSCFPKMMNKCLGPKNRL